MSNGTHHTSYWISTGLISVLMLFAAGSYLLEPPTVRQNFESMGYPRYFPAILGVAKILGVLALLAPRTVRLKEWAYAGFTFTFLGAAISHFASEQYGAIAMPLVAFVLLAVSYATRPPSRRLLNKTTVTETNERGEVLMQHTVASPR